LHPQKNIETVGTATDSIAGNADTLRVAGGKSGQHGPPYFLTGRLQGGKGPADSECHRKTDRPEIIEG